MAARDKMQVLRRGTLALIAGYGVAAAAQVMLARALPLAPIDATIVATMLSFIVYAAAAIWSFAARTAAVAAGGLVVVGVSCGFIWLLLR